MHIKNDLEFINLTLVEIDHMNIEIMKNINDILFPVRYNKSFYTQIISKTYIRGFLFKLSYQIIGVCSFKILKNECYLMTFGILHEYRNNGIGSRSLYLIEKFICQNYNVTYIRLHVHITNKIAIRFYNKNLYQNHGVETNYYYSIEPSHAYVFIKKLFNK
ncbi:gnat family protein [Vairimorpha apis BRL 01]|uniref:Gnat family protein n=1 Tax=Vairimorpha apis BRL 01 TaxID=1037528 RepID=T0L0A2_9MICR|nr:gnat family protein [Vairimorpha apis BRL 01]